MIRCIIAAKQRRRDMSLSMNNLGRMRAAIPLLFAALVCLGLAGCASGKPYSINMMPAPEVFAAGLIDPFAGITPDGRAPYQGILYATDRAPGHGGNNFYTNKAGYILRLGLAEVEIGQGKFTWWDAGKGSILKNRTENYSLSVAKIDEFGPLASSYTAFTPPEQKLGQPAKPAAEFAEKINRKLAISKNKDVNIYVHGYRTVFSNPVLVVGELWHFMGYDGVFLAFSWPATPEVLAYASDLETTALSSRNLRIFLQFIAKKTNAGRINIIGYSAGTRVVLQALNQLALMNNRKEISAGLRIGQVLLIGSDVDRAVFGAVLADGLLDITESMTVYVSGKDTALDFSSRIFRRERLGQMPTSATSPQGETYLKDNPKLNFINVTRAEGSTSGNGHSYFRNSPWASSDILLSLMYDLPPQRRGLVRQKDAPAWYFPEDYVHRLKDALQNRAVVDK